MSRLISARNINVSVGMKFSVASKLLLYDEMLAELLAQGFTMSVAGCSEVGTTARCEIKRHLLA